MIINKIKKIDVHEFEKLNEEYIRHLKQYSVEYLDGNIIKSRNDYLIKFAEIYKFPSYYGKNVDAFVDCMCDLDFRDEQGFIIVIYNYKDMLSGQEREKELFLSLLQQIAFYLEKECLTTSGGRNQLKSFDVYLIDGPIDK